MSMHVLNYENKIGLLRICIYKLNKSLPFNKQVFILLLENMKALYTIHVNEF